MSLKYKNILFDCWEPSKDLDNKPFVWATICKGCQEKYGLVGDKYISDGGSHDCCGVEGCYYSGETSDDDFGCDYIDMYPGEYEIVKLNIDVSTQKFYLENDESLRMIYYNPDSSCGGSFVLIYLDLKFLDALFDCDYNAEDFWAQIYSKAYQENVDMNTEMFAAYYNLIDKEDCLFEGKDDYETMIKLKKLVKERVV